MSDEVGGFLIFVALVAGVVCSNWTTWDYTRGVYQQEAVDRGYAEHVKMDEYGATKWHWMCDVPSDKGTE